MQPLGEPFEFRSTVDEVAGAGLGPAPELPVFNAALTDIPAPDGSVFPRADEADLMEFEEESELPPWDGVTKAAYLTGFKLDLSGVEHGTPGLLAMSQSSLLPFVLNNLVCFPLQDETNGAQIIVSGKFSTDRIVTGFTKPLSSSTIVSKTVTLTVTPKNLAGTVDLRITGQKRATIVQKSIKRDPVAGTVKFQVKGNSDTPADKKKGDTTIEAVFKKQVLDTAQVVVVIPKAVATPHPTFDEEVQGKNMVIDANSRPAAKPDTLKAMQKKYPGKVAIATFYGANLTITVNDQFGDKLSEIYSGIPVTEDNAVINQQLTANGTYTDPVGSVNWMGVIPKATAAAALTNPEVNAKTTTNKSTDTKVEVGGHSLNPAVVNRKLTVTPTGPGKARLKIVWPDK